MTQNTLLRELLPSILGLEEVSFLVAEILGFIGIAVICYGAFKSLYQFLECSFGFRRSDVPHIRIELGKHLALGLEFLVGKDIIESIVHPSWDDLGKLAAIIALRVAVTLMLSWELKEIKGELADDAHRAKKHL